MRKKIKDPSIISYFSYPHGFSRIPSNSWGSSRNFSILASSFEFPAILLDCVRILSDSSGVLMNSSEFSCILSEFSRILLVALLFFGFSRVLSSSSGFSRIPKNSSRIFANCVKFLGVLILRIISNSSGFSNSPVIFRILLNSLGVSDFF